MAKETWISDPDNLKQLVVSYLSNLYQKDQAMTNLHSWSTEFPSLNELQNGEYSCSF